MAADKGTDLTTYIFGFRNITELDEANRFAQKEHAQHSAPLFWVNEFDDNPDNEFVVDITNLGLAVRPDLFDAHTLHWHGFRNVIPFFDGEPTGSVSVPAGTVFRYVYRPRDPGTYMFHCHVEDVEHVHMGMNGLVFVRPKLNVTNNAKYLYNDVSTEYDREFAFHLSEVWAESHWADAHIQLPEWSDYHVDFALLNGRVYPDTLAPNAPYSAGCGARCAVDEAVHAGGDRRRRRAAADSGIRTSAVPTVVLPRDVQCRRTRCAPLLEPRVQGSGDDDRRHHDAGGRP